MSGHRVADTFDGVGQDVPDQGAQARKCCPLVGVVDQGKVIVDGDGGGSRGMRLRRNFHSAAFIWKPFSSWSAGATG